MKKQIYSGLLFAFGLILVLGSESCTMDDVSEFYPDSPCDSITVSYANDVLPIIQQNCYACHSDALAAGAGGGIELEGHAKLVKAIDNLKLICSIKHDCNPMPLGGQKLPDNEIALIENWANCGALDN